MGKPPAGDPLFQANQGIDFDSLSEGTCICGAKISAGYAEGHPTVLHALPMCELFQRIESPIEFLAYVNNRQSN